MQKAKTNVWIALHKLVPLLQKMKLNLDDANAFKEAVEIFHKYMTKAWTLSSITHYMVSLVIILLNCRLCVFQCSSYLRLLVYTLLNNEV